jgi:hypothetical protein
MIAQVSDDCRSVALANREDRAHQLGQAIIIPLAIYILLNVPAREWLPVKR